jgi:hypothetical protein
VEEPKKQRSSKKPKKSAHQDKAVELTEEELAVKKGKLSKAGKKGTATRRDKKAKAAEEAAKDLATSQQGEEEEIIVTEAARVTLEEAAPPQEEEEVAPLQEEEVELPIEEEEPVPPQGEEEMNMHIEEVGAPGGVVVVEPPPSTFKETPTKGQASGSKSSKAKKGKEKEWEDPPSSEEEEEADHGDEEDYEDHEEEEEAVSEERRNPRGQKVPRPRSSGGRPKAPNPPKERVYQVTASLLEGLIAKKMSEALVHQGNFRDYDRGALPKVPAPRKWSDTDAKRPIRKFLEEVEVWFDATDIKGARRVITLPTLLEDTPLEWLLAEKAKHPEGLDFARTWEELKEMMVTRFVPKHQHLLDGIALVKVRQESGRDSLKRYAREFQAKMVPCSNMNEYAKLVNFYAGLEEATRQKYFERAKVPESLDEALALADQLVGHSSSGSA